MPDEPSLTEDAASMIVERGRRHAASLFHLAYSHAETEGSQFVGVQHVERADATMNRQSTQSRFGQFIVIVGGTALGVGAAALVNEASGDKETAWLIAWPAVSFTGLVALAWGILR